ncbi:hypothetical protein PI124_g20688 [Phytophthora idaei]|nr:hypothetical protein PI125_g22515 [Phytophthora idaei]KAG3130668.1 hypothetical protein PI126_g20402 [Phytophthora idaei]KAG3234256.1 hypothetical protein PI124_g20688 [Phytophthora idaei]
MPCQSNEQPPADTQTESSSLPINSTEDSMEQMMAQVMEMMTMQQQSMLAGQHKIQEAFLVDQQQMQAFMVQQAAYQSEMFAQQPRANQQKQRDNPPMFLGKPDDDLELWIFQIEEHFAAYTTEGESDDSRFVNMVVPFPGPDAMSWCREFKAVLGEAPRTWALLKEQIRARFRDSDFDFKLLINMYELQATGTQQEYTSKFMLLLSQAPVDMPETLVLPAEPSLRHKLIYLPKYSD